MRLNELEHAGEFLLVATEIGETPHAVFDYAHLVQVVLGERDDQREPVRLQDNLAVLVTISCDVA